MSTTSRRQPLSKNKALWLVLGLFITGLLGFLGVDLTGSLRAKWTCEDDRTGAPTPPERWRQACEIACNAALSGEHCRTWGRGLSGKGLPPPVYADEALRAYIAGCELEDAPSCSLAGWLHEKGAVGTPDLVKAAAFYRRGCDAGNPYGCRNLGAMHIDGEGVAQDPDKAAELYRGACLSGFADACGNLAALHTKEKSEDRHEIVILLHEACMRGDAARWCDFLADRYRDGDGAREDVAHAEQLYRKGCDAGGGRSCFKLAGLTPDAGQAAALLRKACDSGHQPSCERLGEKGGTR